MMLKTQKIEWKLDYRMNKVIEIMKKKRVKIY